MIIFLNEKIKCNEKAKKLDDTAKQLFDISLNLVIKDEKKYTPYSNVPSLWKKKYTGFKPSTSKLISENEIPKNAQEMRRLEDLRKKESERTRARERQERYLWLDKIRRSNEEREIAEYKKAENLRGRLPPNSGGTKKNNRQLKKRHYTRKNKV